MFNFLFAFDENYNIQGSVSIFSLLENVETKINIYVIKDRTNSTYNFPKKILEHKNLNTLIVKEIYTEEEFYNINTSHVSQATFYRLYLSNLFEKEDFNIVYLDADIVLRNPIDELKLAFEQMSLDLKFIGLLMN